MCDSTDVLLKFLKNGAEGKHIDCINVLALGWVVPLIQSCEDRGIVVS